MAIEIVREYFKAYGRDGDIQEFPVSSATVELAAKALSVDPARIAKTLSFADGDGCLLVVTAGDQKIDNSKFKAVFGMKASMLSPDRVLELTGHAVGGVCPFALPEGVRVTLDVSLRRFPLIYPACCLLYTSAFDIYARVLSDFDPLAGFGQSRKIGGEFDEDAVILHRADHARDGFPLRKERRIFLPGAEQLPLGEADPVSLHRGSVSYTHLDVYKRQA